MINLRTSIKPLTVAISSAILLASLSSYAEVIELNAKKVTLDYPLLTGVGGIDTMKDWLAAPAAYALNPVNIRAGKHPDREDPNKGPYDVIYIFPDAAAANAWWDGNGTPPDEIPDTAVALVHWELDNGSGTFPGIMSKADIPGFKTRNCIMAAGAEIPVPGPSNPAIEKTCNNPQGSSKRFKMNVLIPDVPVDLVYNVEPAPLTYTNYDTLPTFTPAGGTLTQESGRIYRVLQKWHNATAMDAVDSIGQAVKRDGVRIAGFRIELGTGGVGGDFVPIDPAATNPGLEPDKSLGFELRPCMPDHFFDVSRDRPGTGTNPCSDSYDGGGDPLVDQALPQEIWLEEEYSTFSPKMYSFNTDKRTTPVGGWWDKRPAGIYPPEVQLLGKLDSGYQDSALYNRPEDGSTPMAGYYGAMTPNYFDIVANQASGVTGINQPNPFGYLMNFGVLSDTSYGPHGDIGNLVQGVYTDEDGDPATEGDLVAWWDGDEYRWGSDPDVNGEIDGDMFGIVPREQLVSWALHPLEETPDFDKYPDTGFPPGPLYEVGILDDVAGLNVDAFVYLGRTFSGNQFTIRLTAVPVTSSDPYGDGVTPVAGFPMSGGETGNEIPAWAPGGTGTPAPELDTFVNDDGIIDIKALGFAGDPLLVSLADTGIVGSLPTVEIENLRTGEVEDVTLLQAPAPLLWKYTFEQATFPSGDTGASNDGTLNVWPNDFVRVTYVDAFDGTNSDVVKTDEVQIPIEGLEPTPPPPPLSDNGGGCGFCSHNPNGRFDPTLPVLVLIALGFLSLRRKASSDK